jgi:hypothetical protein
MAADWQRKGGGSGCRRCASGVGFGGLVANGGGQHHRSHAGLSTDREASAAASKQTPQTIQRNNLYRRESVHKEDLTELPRLWCWAKCSLGSNNAAQRVADG